MGLKFSECNCHLKIFNLIAGDCLAKIHDNPSVLTFTETTVWQRYMIFYQGWHSQKGWMHHTNTHEDNYMKHENWMCYFKFWERQFAFYHSLKSAIQTHSKTHQMVETKTRYPEIEIASSCQKKTHRGLRLLL